MHVLLFLSFFVLAELRARVPGWLVELVAAACFCTTEAAATAAAVVRALN